MTKKQKPIIRPLRMGKPIKFHDQYHVMQRLKMRKYYAKKRKEVNTPHQDEIRKDDQMK